MKDSREIILNRVRSALISAGTSLPENLGPTPEEILPPGLDLVKRFKEHWQASTGIFHRARSARGLTQIMAKILGPARGKTVMAASSFNDLMPEFDGIVQKLELRIATEPEEFPSVEVGLTGAELALAYSGTIMVTSDNKLDLTASLLPPTHVALIPRSRLVHHIGQAFEHFNKNKNLPPRAAAFISGPSKTADIQLTIVHGVHGPGQAHAVILDYE